MTTKRPTLREQLERVTAERDALRQQLGLVDERFNPSLFEKLMPGKCVNGQFMVAHLKYGVVCWDAEEHALMGKGKIASARYAAFLVENIVETQNNAAHRKLLARDLLAEFESGSKLRSHRLGETISFTTWPNDPFEVVHQVAGVPVPTRKITWTPLLATEPSSA